MTKRRKKRAVSAAAVPENNYVAQSPYITRGMRVKVLNGRDPHAGQVGTVRRVELDGGDLVCVVGFDDGRTGEYWADEVSLKP